MYIIFQYGDNKYSKGGKNPMSKDKLDLDYLVLDDLLDSLREHPELYLNQKSGKKKKKNKKRKS